MNVGLLLLVIYCNKNLGLVGSNDIGLNQVRDPQQGASTTLVLAR